MARSVATGAPGRATRGARSRTTGSHTSPEAPPLRAVAPRLDDHRALAATGRGDAAAPAIVPAPASSAVRDLLADAGRGLGRAIRAEDAADRYAAAHLAALRAAAAMVAARARPVRGRRASVWELIGRVAPEYGEWAAFFAAGSSKRQAALAGLAHAVSAREADDMVRQAAVFVDLMHRRLLADD